MMETEGQKVRKSEGSKVGRFEREVLQDYSGRCCRDDCRVVWFDGEKHMKTSLWASGMVAWILLAGCRSGGKSAGMGGGMMDFEGVPSGGMPAGWRIEETNTKDTPATWRVITDAGAPSGGRVFALTETVNTNGTYNLATAEGGDYGDLDLTVKVLAVSGEEDQGGGPIWRCRDADNYYVCRINPLEDNYRVYKVIGGKRKQLGSARVELSAGKWYALSVRMKGSTITCDLDGEPVLEAEDGDLPHAGMIGLWTKADAVTSFDDLEVRSID